MRPGIQSGHSKFIADNAKKLADELALEPATINAIPYAGILCQIGKMCLPDSILQLSLDKMTNKIKKRYFSHGQEGWRLLYGIEPLKNASELVLFQFEHYDGSGFPHGYSGEQIPIGARILAVVRDYLGLVDGFITGATMDPVSAKNWLIDHKNTIYDPMVVDAFVKILSRSNNIRPVIEISWTQLQVGMEVAEVIYNDILYLKDQILTEEMLDKILEMRKHSKNLILRIRLAG